MKDYLKINIWDLNVILTIAGFPLVTTFISNTTASIIYRGFALLIALLCIFKNGVRLPCLKIGKVFLFILLYASIQMWIDFYLGEYANTFYVASKLQAMLYNIGIVWIPLLALLSGINKLHWKTILWSIFFSLLFVILKGNYASLTGEMTADGRFNLNNSISPISYGDYSAFLILLSCSILLRQKNNKIILKSLETILLLMAIAIGLYGIAKAGSRGPVVGASCGFLYLFYCFPNKWKATSIITFVLLVAGGLLSMSALEKFAPALVGRFENTIEEGDTSNRDVLFQQAIDKWDGHHILGINPISLESTEFSSFHNVYLDTFVATGILGGVIFVVIMLSLAFYIVKWKKKSDWFPQEYFCFAFFLFHLGRGMSGIMLIANAQFCFAFILASYAIHGKLLPKKTNIQHFDTT